MIKKANLEWLKLVEVFSYLIILPLIIFYLVSYKYFFILHKSYYFVVALFLIQASLSYMYSFSALARKRFKELPTAKHQDVPKTTFIVSAYLPNEISVIEDTLSNILEKIERPKAGIEVILAYNEPHMEPIELKLRELAYKWPELILANAYGSRSKSENLNYALDIASGEMIALFDADHLVSSDSLWRAWRWLDEGYDVVQGRCKIRNGSRSPISALVKVEFEAMYGISHDAKSKLFDSTLFGGSNGYWKASVIKKIRFDIDKLTEDIDSTLRALLAGFRIVHDRSIVSTELAPTTLSGLWFQRKRWAQGWFQCSFKYQLPVLKSKYLNIFQKFMWTTLLTWRVFYDLFSHFIFPIVFAFWWYKREIIFPMNSFIWFALIFTFFSGPFEAIVAFKNSVSPRAPVLRYLYYSVSTFFYTMFKNTIQVVAIRDELLHTREWVISARKK
ncbi:MAG: glycosyltransferase family 2 protein [Candidatus Omnitrophota bacterium]